MLRVPRFTRREVLLLTAILFIISFQKFSSVNTGSVRIPHNDSWSHSLIGINFFETGNIQLVGWNRAYLLGQIIPFRFFMSSVAAQNTLVYILSIVGLFALYLFAKSYLARDAAMVVVLLYVLIPEYGLLSTSFMTDIPATTLCFVALLGLVKLESEDKKLGQLTYSSIFFFSAIWAVLIREQSIFLFACSLLVLPRLDQFRRTVLYLGYGLSLIAISVAEKWRRGLPFGDSPTIDLRVENTFALLPPMLFYLSLCLSPLMILVKTKRVSNCFGILRTILFVIPMILFASVRNESFFLGNYLKKSGAYSEVSSAFEELTIFTWPLWNALIIISIYSLIRLFRGHYLLAQFRFDIPFLILILVIFGTLGQFLLGQSVFSRYLLVAIPCASIILIRQIGNLDRRALSRFSPLALVLFIASSLVTSNAHARDFAAWNLATEATIRQSDDLIIGTMEWMRFNEREINRENRCKKLVASVSYPEAQVDYVEYKASVFGGRQTLYLVESNRCY